MLYCTSDLNDVLQNKPHAAQPQKPHQRTTDTIAVTLSLGRQWSTAQQPHWARDESSFASAGLAIA